MSKSLEIGGIWDRPFRLSAIHCRWCPNLDCCARLFLPIGLSSYALALRDSLSETSLQKGRLCSEVGNFENYAWASAYLMNVVTVITLIPA